MQKHRCQYTLKIADDHILICESIWKDITLQYLYILLFFILVVMLLVFFIGLFDH